MIRFAAIAAAAVTGTALLVPAAQATTVSVAVSTGGLSVASSTAGQTVQLTGGGLLAGDTVSGSLGTTTVTETRGTATGWTAKVTVADFVSGGNTIASDQAKVATAFTGDLLCGLGTLVMSAGEALTRDAATGKASRTVASCGVTGGILGTGSHTVSWAETLSLAVPATAAAGTYTSTVTRSVQ